MEKGIKDSVVSKSVSFSSVQYAKYIDALSNLSGKEAAKYSVKELLADAIDRFLKQLRGERLACCENTSRVLLDRIESYKIDLDKAYRRIEDLEMQVNV